MFFVLKAANQLFYVICIFLIIIINTLTLKYISYSQKTRLLEAEHWFLKAKELAPNDSSVYQHFGKYPVVVCMRSLELLTLRMCRPW